MRFHLIILLLFSWGISQDSLYTIKGEAAYAHGVLIGDAEVVLMDTTEKVIQKTRTSKKFLKRYGGGKFKLNDVPPGDYILNINLGTRTGIRKRFLIKDKDLDFGLLYNVVDFPKYEIGDYPVSDVYKMRRISTTPIRSDTINIKHVIVDLNGNANTIIVDSMVSDSVYYTDFDNLIKHVIDLDKVYFIYNDYGIFIHQSRSMKDRMKELQRRDGFMVFHSGDTLQFDNIYFEQILNNPEVGTFHKEDSTTDPRFHSLMDIYYVKTGKSFLENSVRKGFYLGLTSVLSGNYGTIITVVPIVTLGKVGYDWYRDLRSNYFMPKNENDPFPRNMFVFSLSEWVWKKSQPIIQPIMNSKPVKWWTKRKLRKLQKQAAKRKSASD